MKHFCIFLALLSATAVSAQTANPVVVVLLNGAPVKPISAANKSILVSKGDIITFNIKGLAMKKYRFGKVVLQPTACTNGVNMPQRQYTEMRKPVAATEDVLSIENPTTYYSSFAVPTLRHLVPDLAGKNIDDAVFEVYSVFEQSADNEPIEFGGKKRYTFKSRKDCKVVSGGRGLGKARGN